ncbi:aminotransferase class V-fold PLP-dependent enzyme [Shewanella mangrovisoli]|uniref:aminotransferase class V-fold PLP-dependent enzyme n=1 Tax=Shewanella mangrovisoli TaxID=2864211 RepID=UPI001C661614|nr:aminotransferase class V-fold PLP-dependent enzyme [Shewanella mangrovisoli]QYK09459.1 aminotransferase class V-fold PLP-dependent enzyme [Shewanella mangrovisoli]
MLLNVKQDFCLAGPGYLLNHSVGRPLKSTEQAFKQAFFAPWQESGREPWGQWLGVIDNFTAALASLFNGQPQDFCPQVNLSSALTKLVMSLDRLNRDGAVVLMSEIDFPSMGFALKKALPASCELRFIPKGLDVTDPNVWDAHICADVDLVFVSHAYSNTGQQAPLAQIIPLARERGCLSLVDVAQSAGILPLDLAKLQPDFMIGSSVKWLCSGPGAAYLWVNPAILPQCQPQDVGWFSHENPFEFDIHDFRYHPTALRFWGGTPSIAPYAIAAHSIQYFANIGSLAMREHNLQLMETVVQTLECELVSPREADKRSGTLILQFGERQAPIMAALAEANISVDARSLGIRVSPHIYNDEADIAKLLEVIKAHR